MAEGFGDLADLAGGFVSELEAEMADAGGEPRLEMETGLLGLRAEDGVAAAGVGEHGVAAAVDAAELDAVGFAGSAAILVRGAGGEEAAEEAVLGVEDGEVLVGDDLDAGSAQGVGKSRDLGGVEVVGGGDALEAEIEESAGAEEVGGVEAEVAGEGLGGAGTNGVEEAGGADEDGAIEAKEEVGDLLLAGLEDAGAGDAGLEAGVADTVEGGLEAVEVEVVEGDGGGAESDGGVELAGGADEEVEGGAGLEACPTRVRKAASGSWMVAGVVADWRCWSWSTASRRSWFSREAGAKTGASRRRSRWASS